MEGAGSGAGIVDLSGFKCLEAKGIDSTGSTEYLTVLLVKVGGCVLLAGVCLGHKQFVVLLLQHK